MKITKTLFGTTASGEKAYLYLMKNRKGMELVVSDFGAVIQKILVPDRDGHPVDVVLGFDALADYDSDHNNTFGAFVGRNANRIGGAVFTLNGKTYQLAKNDGENNLHSGPDNLSNRVMYETECFEEPEMATVEFSRMSPDMEQGFPGNLDMTVSYSLTEEGEVVIEYFADCDQDTICNLTNHSYFNLSGEQADTILDHVLMLKSDAFTPTDSGLIPTGEIRDVTGTPMDFRVAKPIGQDIEADYEPLVTAGGYDHNFVLPDAEQDEPVLAGTVMSPVTGITMDIYTDLPGMQVYTGNFLNGEVAGKKGKKYPRRSGVCFETQFFPNACNMPEGTPGWETSVLPAHVPFESTTIYRFHA